MIFNENRKNQKSDFQSKSYQLSYQSNVHIKIPNVKKYSSKNMKSVRVCAKSCLFLFVTWIFEWNKFKETLLTQSISIIWNNPFTPNVKKYYPLVMTNSSPWKPWPIEIDGLPGFTYGLPMVFLWFTYGLPMVFLWFTYGLPIKNGGDFPYDG